MSPQVLAKPPWIKDSHEGHGWLQVAGISALRAACGFFVWRVLLAWTSRRL